VTGRAWRPAQLAPPPGWPPCNVNTGAFQVYNIANNQITGSASLGRVGLDWELGGFAAVGSTDSPALAQLVQAMSSFSPEAGPSLGVTALEAQDAQAAQMLAAQAVASHA
jgi:hypothetical protein